MNSLREMWSVLGSVRLEFKKYFSTKGFKRDAGYFIHASLKL